MSIWAIADIHASRRDPGTGVPAKPMDVFGSAWANHVDRLETAWWELVDPGDTVIIAGDTDWALRLDDALDTLRRIDSWPGQKVLLRGNHDYWWSSKATGKVRAILPPSVRALHNDAIVADGINICGAKGSPVPGAIDWSPQDEKIMRRELQRLETSLSARKTELPTICALHYPPFFPSQGHSAYSSLLERDGVALCVYGHLHGDASAQGPQGEQNGVTYRLVAGDAVGFRPVLVGQGGAAILDAGLEYAG